MIITLENLECELKYDYEPPTIGGSHPDGSVERLGANVSIYSAICKGVELVTLIEHEQLEAMESKILESLQREA